jgi:predicted component of type VI protein secretion system
MEAKLILVGGKASKSEVLLKLPAIIGRSREAGLTIAHPMVSRKHCEIFESEGMLRIRDLGSLNGTFIGERQIIEAPLRPDDEFTVGPLTFRVAYELPGDPAASRANGRRVDEPGSTTGEAIPAPPPAEAPPVAPPEASAPGLFPGNVPVPDLRAWADASARHAPSPPPVESVDLEPVEINPAQAAAEDLETPDWAAEPVVWAETPGSEDAPRGPIKNVPRPARANEEAAGENAGLAPASAPRPAPHAAEDRPKRKGWWPFRRSGSKGGQDQPSSGAPAEPVGEEPPAAGTAQAPEAPSPPDPELEEFLRKLR